MKKVIGYLAIAAGLLLGGLVFIAYMHAVMTGPTWLSVLLVGVPVAAILLFIGFTVWRYPGHFFPGK